LRLFDDGTLKSASAGTHKQHHQQIDGSHHKVATKGRYHFSSFLTHSCSSRS
jgi:hypothetical protein